MRVERVGGALQSLCTGLNLKGVYLQPDALSACFTCTGLANIGTYRYPPAHRKEDDRVRDSSGTGHASSDPLPTACGVKLECLSSYDVIRESHLPSGHRRLLRRDITKAVGPPDWLRK